jgi:cytochrome c2
MRSFLLIVLVAAIVGGACLGWSSSRRDIEQRAGEFAHGDPARGRRLIATRGCVACHAVPGFSGTEARVGPPLVGFASRSYVAGAATNTPDNLIRFLRDPRSVEPRSAMPNLKLDERDAHDLAAFLYTLE